MTTDQSSGSLARRPAHDSRGVEFNSARRALAWHGDVASLTSCEHKEAPRLIHIRRASLRES